MKESYTLEKKNKSSLLKSILLHIRKNEIDNKILYSSDLLKEFFLKKSQLEAILFELKSEDFIEVIREQFCDLEEKVIITDKGIAITDKMLDKRYNSQNYQKILFFLRKHYDQNTPIYFEDLMKYLWVNYKNKTSQLSQLLGDLSEDGLIKIRRSSSNGKRKVIWFTKMGYFLSNKLSHNGLKEYEIRFLRLINSLNLVKREKLFNKIFENLLEDYKQ